MSLFATKPISRIIAEAEESGEHTFKKALSALDLTTLGIGAIIGAIAGGGKGAAIGAIIGGGAGAAGTMTQRGKDIRLERGQRIKIRTSTDTNAL